MRETMNRLDVQTRWLIRRDMPEVLRIEGDNNLGGLVKTWNDDDFFHCLTQRNCIGMVAEHDLKVVGFMIYELHNSRLHMLNFAVGGEYQRRGVGRQMLERMFDKLTQQRRNELFLDVHEANLDAQLFLRAMGFKCRRVERDAYATGHSAYRFVYSLPEALS